MIIKVKVKPNSKKQGIKKINDVFLISLKEKPEDNKANLELLKIFKKKFGKKARIVKGLKSKNKILELE